MNQKVKRILWEIDMESLTVPIGLTPKLEEGKNVYEVDGIDGKIRPIP